LPSQYWNWLFFHITKELNNVLAAAGISQSSSDDTQVTQSIRILGRPSVVNVSSGGTTIVAQVTVDTMIVVNNGTTATVDISAGALFVGCRLYISEKNATGVTIQTGAGMTALLPKGTLALAWDGSAWEKVGGASFTVVFTSGTGATFNAPWSGYFKGTVVGGGAGGAAYNTGDGWKGHNGGSAGGVSVKTYYLTAGATLTYTVGPKGTGGSAGANPGNNGTASTLGDGTTTITGNGGVGGARITGSDQLPSLGGTATNGDLNIPGCQGGLGSLTASPMAVSGQGGDSPFGAGGLSRIQINATVNAGSNGVGNGSGGSGASGNTDNSAKGGDGTDGLVMIEF
jgi:hypothetical protein